MRWFDFALVIVGFAPLGCFSPDPVGEAGSDTDNDASAGSDTAPAGPSSAGESDTAAETGNDANCGNGILDPGEDCEDGNDDDDDACVMCRDATCGDGFVYAALEECDDGNDIDEDACKADCTANVCGDGIIDPSAEECDDGNENNEDACKNDCTTNVCGDGVVNPEAEECDDGDAVNTNDCKNDCTDADCGDGVTHDGVEACDDGNDDNTDLCTTECTELACGDGYQQLGEQCDDGNTDSYDGCSAGCAEEPNCFDWGNVGCPTGAQGFCVQGNVSCDSEADAMIACEVCHGEGQCENVTVCSDSTAMGNPEVACPDQISFVWGSAICAAGNIINECPGGGNNGSWCSN